MSSASSSNEENHSQADVLLYAESKLTRKQAVREIAGVVLKANMKPKTVKYALNLLKILLPPENTLPSTVDELFGAMLSSENDWRLAQYLIKYKQRPSFLSALPSSNIWSENSNLTNSLHATTAVASSSSIPTDRQFDSIVQSSPLFLPIDGSSSSSSESDSESDSSNSSSSDDDDDDESSILLALQDAQQQRTINSSAIGLNTASSETNTNHLANTMNYTSDQRSQIVSSSLNQFPFLGSFKRRRHDTSSDDSSSEPDVFLSTRLPDNNDDSDNETSFYSISNNNNNNNKSCCFEMNGCDLLDGGKRRRS